MCLTFLCTDGHVADIIKPCQEEGRGGWEEEDLVHRAGEQEERVRQAGGVHHEHRPDVELGVAPAGRQLDDHDPGLDQPTAGWRRGGEAEGEKWEEEESAGGSRRVATSLTKIAHRLDQGSPTKVDHRPFL